MARKKRGLRPSVQPQSSGPLVEEVFRWLKLDESARSFRALRAFSRAAGPRIGARARGERLRGATLYVRVTSAAWSQELSVLKAQLIEKLQRTPGGESVMDLRFSVGPLDDLPDWESLAPTLAPVAPSPASAGSMYTPLPDELAGAVSAVVDPELREELSRVLGMTSGKRRLP